MLRLSAGHRHFDHRAAPVCAREFGWFAEPVVIDATGEDDRTVAALHAGATDIGLDIAPSKVLHDHLAGGGLVIVGGLANGVGQVLVGAKSLQTVEDLRGRRIHVVEQGTGVDWHPLRILLRRRGIDPDREVVLVPGAPYPLFRNAQAAFERDEADARMILHAEMPAARAARYPVLFDFLAEYPPDYPQRVIVTTREFAAREPDRLHAFLRGMIRAYRYLRDERNYADAMRLMREHIQDPGLGFPAGITDHFLSSHYFGFKQMPADGNVSAPSLQRYIDEEALEGRLPTGLDAAAVMDPAPSVEAVHAIEARFGSAY